MNVLVGFFRSVEILNAKISAKMLQKWRDFNGREIRLIFAVTLTLIARRQQQYICFADTKTGTLGVTMALIGGS